MTSAPQQSIDPWLPHPGDVVADKYRIEHLIARGGMGAVFAATHRVTGRRVALKWLLQDGRHDAEATRRLIREAQAAARIQHVNVVDVYDVGEHDGSLFLVMELLEGQTLAALEKERGALPALEALRIMLPALRGVQAAHRKQVVHRDLKPSNIFLSHADGAGELIPRVLDFGVCKVMHTPFDSEYSLTRTGEVIGTPFYMAPEQLADGPVDERSDIYALGIILYQALSGRLPFQDTNYNKLVVKIATAAPTPLAELQPELPRGLAQVVMRAMAREPSARFSDVQELIDALVPFTTVKPSASPATLSARRLARRVGLVLCALALLAFGFAWLAGHGDVKATPVVSQQPARPPVAVALPAPPPAVPAVPVAPQPSAAPPPTPEALAPSAVAAVSAQVAPPAQTERQPPPAVSAPEAEKPARAHRRKHKASGSSVVAAPRPDQPVQISAEQF